MLPEDTIININTASETVLLASVAGLDTADARRLIQTRENKPFRELSDAQEVLPGIERVMLAERFGVQSRFFEIRGQLRLDSAIISERSLVLRQGLEISVLWRERFSAAASTP